MERRGMFFHNCHNRSVSYINNETDSNRVKNSLLTTKEDAYAASPKNATCSLAIYFFPASLSYATWMIFCSIHMMSGHTDVLQQYAYRMWNSLRYYKKTCAITR